MKRKIISLIVLSLFLGVRYAFSQNDIRDITGPVNFPVSYVWILILAALILVVIFLLRKRIFRKRAHYNKEAWALPAHAIALSALTSLKEKNLPAQGKVKEYYIELSLIVRHYLEERFMLRAPKMSTEEFLFMLRESRALVDVHKVLLKDFLEQCDLVKFAKYGPTQNEMDESFRLARKLVEETIPPVSVIGE